ncbi:aspartate aminotransferase family protein [Mumia sp. zg.B53]|uniref:aspartate aminotransferase family protein n=1 Tax=unclassified Mumia TaxID=2621872 RepID=UPI001C6ED66F|nr:MULTISPECIES: aspartate aminotransferase family protein [unclassified Mumia]MBW9204378.1 aspartate aminotransferase family protein [Mumia sp. zg.B17]MBW9214241.1 aspartate aminotransferase family protein [Mumia sp. zg.B53]MDD9348077.1 aspartate aminotransferase family protein [Mumia sp.]
MTNRTYELDRAHVFHSWVAQASMNPMVIESAEGSYVVDDQGQRYLDFSSQLVFTNIGHQHPRVVKAIQDQAARLCTIAPQHANAARSEAAALVAELAPEGMDRVFFTNGGADAVEHAVRMARLHTGRRKVLSRYRSYHGGTQTAVNLTGDPRRWPNDYGADGVVHFFGPFLYRTEFHATTEAEECERALTHLEHTIQMEGPDTIAAIILETIPGTAGIMPPPPGYLEGVRALCDRYGIVWIADEVMAGFGRTGTWFALDLYDATPDLITFAKGVTSGYVPLGGVIISEPIYETFADRPYPGGLTYSGHPLACAAAVATIETMKDERIVENAATLGETVFAPGLAELAERHPCVGEVRGVGAFWALDLVADRETREPLAPYGGTSPAMNEIVAACKKHGLLPFVNYHRLHVVPALNITADEARAGLAVLDEALSVGDAHAAR